jgi:hypothetical protein
MLISTGLTKTFGKIIYLTFPNTILKLLIKFELIFTQKSNFEIAEKYPVLIHPLSVVDTLKIFNTNAVNGSVIQQSPPKTSVKTNKKTHNC